MTDWGANTNAENPRESVGWDMPPVEVVEIDKNEEKVEKPPAETGLQEENKEPREMIWRN